ncbi:peptidoglycan-associated lipoprotein Pal [Azonexus sp.]|jgi:peptidoglycan-associated lipoprotein|uniref:peptidoglycan-associated lipoprotein Pal n=1 Tax=Azonexus sp. TaxID=1872668 RepID=UPI0028378282|nr:peptidoglycan-associated lipoprotein Pal [Azonexus sp.]MDR1994135.1 peptidoglycan-associated lipoprotein Pal [Azonexus sp.]
MRHAIFVAIVASALLLSACGSQPPAPEQDAAPVTIGSSTVTPVTTGSVDSYNLDALKDPSSAVYKRSVFFDFDKYEIRDEFKPLLEAHAKFLIRNSSLKVLIQGNADDRGSREYNLALGQKRAETIKRTLLLQGVAESQLEAVSLGKEKPRCSEATEICWAQNRRGDILYSGEY